MIKFKNIIHDYLINKLLNNSSLSKEDIDTKSKIINLGLCSIATYFLEPKHNIILCILIRWFGYKLYEKRICITWCDTRERVYEYWREWEGELNKRSNFKLSNKTP